MRWDEGQLSQKKRYLGWTLKGKHNAGYTGLISESERSPGEGNGNPLQYSIWENPMDRGAGGRKRVKHN